MKKLVLLIVCFNFTSFSQANYFPLEVGNYWQYKVTHYSSLNGTTYSYAYMEVLKDTLIGIRQELYKKVKSLILAPFFTDSIDYLKYDSTLHSIMNYNVWQNSESVFFKLDALPAECWENLSAGLICYVNLDTANIFGENKLSKSFGWGSFVTVLYAVAEDFGPIEVYHNESYVITLTHTYELIYAKINGIEYGQLVSVSEEHPELPTAFYLSQNYPNPFNPSTKISWQSPVSGWQTLKVYDVLGNEVATLVSEYKLAGSYEVEFNSTVGSHQLANGVYFYQLKAGDYNETKKMILIK